MKKISGILSIVLCISIILSLSLGVTANASSTDFDGRYEDIGSPVFNSTIELEVYTGSRPWQPGDPLDDATIKVNPCGSIAKAYYNDKNTAIFLVGFNHEVMCVVSNGKAKVNGREYIATQIGENLYEIEVQCPYLPEGENEHDIEIGVPAIAGTLEIDVFLDSSRKWVPGDSLENVTSSVKPCGRVAIAFYNDMQTAIFVVEIDPNMVYFASNGLATVNGNDCIVEQVSENLYEIRFDCDQDPIVDIGVPAVGGTLQISAKIRDFTWVPGNPLDDVVFEVYPCGNVTKAYYNDMGSAIIVVEVNPDMVYFVSNGLATVNGKEYTLQHTGETRYEIRIDNEKEEVRTVKHLVIDVDEADFLSFTFEVRALDEEGNVVSKEIVNVTGNEPLVLSFPSSVSELVIREVVPNNVLFDESYALQIPLNEGRTVLKLSTNSVMIRTESELNIEAIRHIVQLVNELFNRVKSILGK